MRSVLALLLAACAVAPALANSGSAPVNAIEKRASHSAPAPITDIAILNFALTLEYLEATFYTEGLKHFSSKDFSKAGFDKTLYARFMTLASQERTHVSFLAGALGEKGVHRCKYNFKTAFSSVDAFVSTARLLEGVGTSAYLSASVDISNKDYLAAAGSILTVEARHSSLLNEATHISGFPTAFESSLNYAQVYSLASTLIVKNSCGPKKDLPSSIQVFPVLTATPVVPIPARAHGPHGHGVKHLHVPLEISLDFVCPKHVRKVYAAFINNGQTIYAEVVKDRKGKYSADVPKEIKQGSGVVYVLISTISSGKLANANTIAGPAVVYF